MAKRWIVLCCHDGSAPPEWAKCFDDYQDALAYAGKYWETCGLNFDITRKRNPFYVDPESRYVEDVEVTRVAKKIRHVSHANGDGPSIEIMPESK